MQTIASTHRRERGQSIVLMALMITGLVAFVGLALDGGQFFEMRRQAQNAADAAALAGIDEFAEGVNPLIYYRINQYAIGNANVGNGATSFKAEYYASDGFYPGSIPVTPGSAAPLGTDCVRVTATKTFDTLIISFLGFNTLSVGATASGCVGQVVHATTPLWPITILNQGFQLNQPVDLYDNSQAAPGQFGWVSYDGLSSANDLRPKLQDGGYGGPFYVYDYNACDGGGLTTALSLGLPTCIRGVTGNMASLQDAAAAQVGKIVVMPLYDRVSGQGANTFYHMVGFAAFKVMGVCLQSSGTGNCAGVPSGKKVIRGQFVKYVITGQWCKVNCGPDWGLKTIKLMQ